MPKRKATDTKAVTSEEKEEQKETQPQTKKTKVTKKDNEEEAKSPPRRSTRSKTKGDTETKEKPSTPQKKSKAKGDEEEPKKGTPKKSKGKGEEESESKKGTPKKSKGSEMEEEEPKKGTPKKSQGKGDEESESKKGTPKKSKGSDVEEEKADTKAKKDGEDEGKKSTDKSSKKGTPSEKTDKGTPKKKKGKEDEEEEPKSETPKKSKGKGDEEDESKKGTPKKSKGKGDEESESKKGTPKKSKGSEMEEEKEVDTKTKQVGTEKSTKETKVSGRKLNRESESTEETGAEESSRPLELGDGKIPGDKVLIASWNVNGLNAMVGGKKKDLHDYLKDRKPDILCLSETKLNDDGIDKIPTDWVPEGYSSYWSCCRVKKGYAGTAIISKYKPISVKYGIGVKKHDQEGRTITAEFENFYLVACYIPNAGEKLVELKYRTEDWDPAFSSYVNDLKKKKHTIVCGDLNCAYEEIDIHKAKGSERLAGFTPQERKSFGELLGTGFVDTFRHLHPEEQKFSYFSARFNNRASNKGWRLDYFLVDKEGLGAVKESEINQKIFGSDHVPIELVLDPSFK